MLIQKENSGNVSSKFLIPGFERTLQLEHEFAGVGAVDEAVIEAEA